MNKIAVLHGPPPADPVSPQRVPMSGPSRVVGLAFATLLLLGIGGLGWAMFLLPPGVRSFEVLALAPAFGLASVIVGGMLIDGTGIRLTGVAGAATPVAAAIAGWALAGRRLMRIRELFPAG